MVEWSNPIFYINAGGCALSIFAFTRLRSLSKEGKADGAWVPFLGILAIGTFIHFLGDLIDYPDDIDHVFIHAVILAAVGVLAFQLLRGER
jgi:hypothetical protein